MRAARQLDDLGVCGVTAGLELGHPSRGVRGGHERRGARGQRELVARIERAGEGERERRADRGRRAGVEGGVDQQLVAVLHAVEARRVDPARARRRHLHARGRAQGQAARDLRGCELGAQDHAALLAQPGDQAPRQPLALLATVGEHDVDALERRGPGDRGGELGGGRRARGGDQIAPHQQAPALARAGGVRQRPGQVGGAERPAHQQAIDGGVIPAARVPVEDGLDRLIEGDHAQRQLAAEALAQRPHQRVQAQGVAAEVPHPRGAGVEQDGERGHRLGGATDERREARDRQAAGAHADRGVRAGHRGLEVGARGPAVLGHAHHAPVDGDVHAQPLHDRQAVERQPVRRALRAQLVHVRDDQPLAPARRDGEDPRHQATVGRQLGERGVDAPVHRRLVGFAAADDGRDLRLVPRAAFAHGQARDRGALKQREREAALERAVLGVLEGEVQLGEGERPLHRGARVQLDEAQAGAVRGRQRDRRGAVTARRRVGARGVEDDPRAAGKRRGRDLHARHAEDEHLRARAAAGRGQHAIETHQSQCGHVAADSDSHVTPPKPGLEQSKKRATARAA